MSAPKGRLVTPVAFDASGYPRSLEVDALDRLRVVTANSGYSDRLLIETHNADLAAGTNTLDVDPVPAGWIWVVTHLSMMYIGTVPTSIWVFITHDVTTIRVFQQLSPYSLGLYDRQGWWVLKEGDFIRYRVYGATLHDDFYGHANGFKVQLTP